MIRALIADDEPLARTRLRTLLEPHAEVRVVAECGSAREAAAVIEQEAIDLLFLDVEMPHGSGFDLLHVLDDAKRPVVIFTTAHGEFALEAFDAAAADYLVKPFDQTRLTRALERARALIGGTVPAPRVSARRDRFAVRVRGEIVFVKAASIEWISAEGNYSRLHVGPASYLLRESMQRLDDALDSTMFARVHRSAIVNLDRVEKLVSATDGSLSIILATGDVVPLGPSYRTRLETILGHKL